MTDRSLAPVMTEDRTAVIVGASSGIGEALARELAERGYTLGLTARREDRLESIAADLPTEASIARMDVTETDAARETFHDLAEELGGADVVVLNAGVAFENTALDWEPERDTIDVNVRGFVALATAAMDHFEERGSGHLVGTSSIAAHVGNSIVPAYHASKAFVSNYLSGLHYRTKYRDADLTVTTVEPGFVDTELATGTFWLVDVETAAEQMADAIEKKRRHVYVSRRWRLVAWALKALPESLQRRVL
jgi:short-subunit dehydrogenase